MTRGRLRLRGVEVHSRGRTILKVDDLEIPSASFAGIIGTNGAGKTTLLKVCCGLLKPERGTIELDDANLAELGAWNRSNLRKRIGYIPQAAEYNSELPFTLREVVCMGRISTKGLLTRLSKEDHAIVDRWIDRLGLSSLRNQTFRSLSGGEQQKALVARAMAQQPEILMLDEPCANLDFNWKYQITEIIEQLYHDVHMTILMVSHDTSVLPGACSRLVLLHEGNVLADGHIDDVLAAEALETAYQCRIEMRDVGGRKYTINRI
jgi:iron complex transport system ATP-binding protein